MINEVSFYFLCLLRSFFDFIFGGDQSNDLVVFTAKAS